MRSMLPSLNEIETALRLARGSISDAAELLKLERPILARKVQATPSLEKVMRDIREQKLDDAEKALDALVLEKNPTAVTFMLKTLGRDRGYSDKTTIEHEMGEGAKSAAALIAAMRKEVKALPLTDDVVIEVEATPIEVSSE